MSESPINMEYLPINSNMIEPFASEELLFPISKDVVELNRFFLESNLDDKTKGAMSEIPRLAGPTHVHQPKSTFMPTLSPHTLADPIKVAFPDGVSPNEDNFMLLDKPLEDSDLNKFKSSKTPEEIVTPEILNQAQNINHISVENGLKPIPHFLNDNKPDSIKNTKVDSPVPIVVEMPYPLPLKSGSIPEEDAGDDYTPVKFKVAKGYKRTLIKKGLLWISVGLVIYLIVLLFKRK